MLNSVIILSILHSTFASPLVKLDGRIVGGNMIGISKTPYIVSIQNFYGHLCGGSLIADDWVLSAAHCFQGYGATFKVRAGSSLWNLGGQLIDVTTVIKHSGYNTISQANDIALLKLSNKVKLSESVKIISLATKQDLLQGSRAYLAGWGYTNETSSIIPKILHGVEVSVISQEACRKQYTGYPIFDSNVCAFALGKDSCQGDSGGPMVTNGKLSGITSWGSGCGSTYPGVYTSVPCFVDWIKNNTEIYSENMKE